MKYAVVDIETTGLYHQGHGITEVAVVHFDGRKSELVFSSLINPGRDIPQGIRHLTGIENSTVSGAPQFEEVMDAIREALEDRVFVAHNVNFDYNFLKAAFEKQGSPFQYKRFCTMRYSRQLLPKLGSHSLKSVCNALDVKNSNTHRAAGDALATSEILRKLNRMDSENILVGLLNSRSRNTILPPAITREEIDALPASPGVYYFYDVHQKPIYIGKAKNVKRRVLSHFTASSSSRKKQVFQRQVERIEHTPTLTEYEASLLEDAEIKKWWPVLNRAQKIRVSAFAVIPYQARSGKTRLGILETRERSDALAWFDSYQSAKVWLYRGLLDYGIDPAIAGFYSPEKFEIALAETRLTDFIQTQQKMLRASFLIRCTDHKTKGFGVGILNGKYKGFGHFEVGRQSRDEVEANLHLAPDSLVAKSVIRKMLSDENYEILTL